jgi:hypothetical protein
MQTVEAQRVEPAVEKPLLSEEKQAVGRSARVAVACRGVRKLEQAKSSRATMIEVQEATEPLPTLDRAVVVFGSGLGVDQPVAQPLVMSLSVVVLNKLPNDEPEVRLAEGDDVIETLASNRSDEALGEGIEIRTAGR